MSLRITKTRVAVYKYFDIDMECVYSEDMESCTDLVRISEYIDVLFSPRAEEEIIPDIIAGLDKEAAKVREEAIASLNKIAERKAEILQITFVPSDGL